VSIFWGYEDLIDLRASWSKLGLVSIMRFY
jgi:hypothetical protein